MMSPEPRRALVLTVTPPGQDGVVGLLRSSGWHVDEVLDPWAPPRAVGDGTVVVFDLAALDPRLLDAITRSGWGTAVRGVVALLSPETAFLREALAGMGFASFLWRNDPAIAHHLEAVTPGPRHEAGAAP